MYELGLIEAVSVPQQECFDAAIKFCQTEGIVSAPEPTHALAHVIQEANRWVRATVPAQRNWPYPGGRCHVWRWVRAQLAWRDALMHHRADSGCLQDV